MMPHCGRCVKKGKTDKCVYHPAPLTKAGVVKPQVEDGRRERRTPRDVGNETAAAAYLDHLGRSSRSTSFSGLGASVQSVNGPPASTPTSFSVSLGQQSPSRPVTLPLKEVMAKPQGPASDQFSPPGILRSTNVDSFISHSAVLAENESSIGLSPPVPTESNVSALHIDKGAAVLFLFKDLDSTQKYIDKWFSFAGGVVVIEPMVKIYLDGIWSTWGKILESAKVADLQAMSAQIWENTAQPLSLLLKPSTTPRDFCASVTGANLRWEVLGIIASLVSLVAQSLKGMLPIP